MTNLTNVLALLAAGASTEEYSIAQLVAAYNEGVTKLDRPGDVVKSFKDHATATKRVKSVLVEVKAQAALDRKAKADKAAASPKPAKGKKAPKVRSNKSEGTAAGIDERAIKVVNADAKYGGTRATLFALVRDGMTVDAYLAAAEAAKVERNKARFELRHMRNTGAVKF